MQHHPGSFSAQLLLRSLSRLSAANCYYVGFSGGADSTALLQALHALDGQLANRVQAVHINHGLDANSGQWQSHCEAFCQQRSIRLTCLQITVPGNTGKGLEAEARRLRYHAIEALLSPGDSLLTAHHANDQAETVLLNLMRGSGVDGLSAMPAERPLGAGKLQRPLLEFHSIALQEYLRGQDIKWLEDPSNQILSHDRNFIRHAVMPLLEQRFRGTEKRLLLTCQAMAETRPLLESFADDCLKKCLVHPCILQLDSLPITDPGRFKLVIRRWLKRSTAASMPARQLQSLHQQINCASVASQLYITWQGAALHLYKGRLWLQTGRRVKVCDEVEWPTHCNAVELGEDAGRLECTGAGKALEHPGLVTATRNSAVVKTLLRNGHHHNLKKLFQAASVPHWLRESIPLTHLDGELVSIGDWYLSDRFSAWLSENQFKMVWRPNHPLLQYIRAQQHAPLPHNEVDATPVER